MANNSFGCTDLPDAILLKGGGDFLLTTVYYHSANTFYDTGPDDWTWKLSNSPGGVQLSISGGAETAETTWFCTSPHATWFTMMWGPVTAESVEEEENIQSGDGTATGAATASAVGTFEGDENVTFLQINNILPIQIIKLKHPSKSNTNNHGMALSGLDLLSGFI